MPAVGASRPPVPTAKAKAKTKAKPSSSTTRLSDEARLATPAWIPSGLPCPTLLYSK
jgi:hypothetical protein